jgi:hypothetical protein
MHISSDRGNRDRRAELARRTGLCDHCRPNGGENAGRRAKPDAYKTARKGKRK